MADNRITSYTAGQGRIVPVLHTGPTSYATGGETIGNSTTTTGVSVAGLTELDQIIGSGSLAVSGNYWVMAQPVGTGPAKTFKLLWFTASAGVPTLTQVSASTNLSGETVKLCYVGR